MRNLWLFLVERGKFILLPIILVILLAGLIIIFSSHSAVAPFIYTLF
jgi:hypothetical protein